MLQARKASLGKKKKGMLSGSHLAALCFRFYVPCC
jgi:hypothetical protein